MSSQRENELIKQLDQQYAETGRVPDDGRPQQTAQEAPGDAQTATPHPAPSAVPAHAQCERAGARPWHLDVGWDGGLTAVVDIEGYLVADCEPQVVGDHGLAPGAGEANARHIVRAVAVLDAMIRWRAKVERSIRREGENAIDRDVLKTLAKAGV